MGSILTEKKKKAKITGEFTYLYTGGLRGLVVA